MQNAISFKENPNPRPQESGNGGVFGPAVACVDESAWQSSKPDPKLVQALVRAHTWVRMLTEGSHGSIEELASSIDLNPKVVRKSIRLAFLTPDVTEAILKGTQPQSMGLRNLQQTLPLSWTAQHEVLGLKEVS